MYSSSAICSASTRLLHVIAAPELAQDGVSLLATMASPLVTQVLSIALTARLGCGVLCDPEHACAASTSEGKAGCDGTRLRTARACRKQCASTHDQKTLLEIANANVFSDL
jgi:hypothetical protein